MEMSLDDIIKANRDAPNRPKASQGNGNAPRGRTRGALTRRPQGRASGGYAATVNQSRGGGRSGTVGVRQAAQARREAVRVVRGGRVGNNQAPKTVTIGIRQRTITKQARVSVNRNAAQLQAAQKILKRARTGAAQNRGGAGPMSRLAPLTIGQARRGRVGIQAARAPVVFNPKPTTSPKFVNFKATNFARTTQISRPSPAARRNTALNITARLSRQQQSNSRGFGRQQQRGRGNARQAILNRPIRGGVQKFSGSQRAPLVTGGAQRFGQQGRNQNQNRTFTANNQRQQGGRGRGNNNRRGFNTNKQNNRAPYRFGNY